jgi:hypothetical protein
MGLKQLLGGMTLVIAMAACSKGGGDVDAFVKLDTDKAAAFSAGGEDCTAKAKSVGDWRKAHTKDYKAMQKKLNDAWGGSIPKDVQDKYGDQMKSNKKAVMEAMMKCTNTPDFDKMMDDTKTAE